MKKVLLPAFGRFTQRMYSRHARRFRRLGRRHQHRPPCRLGTSIEHPCRLDKTKTTKDTDSDGIRITEEQIVTYFDAHGTPSNSAVKGGFHRQLISKRNNEYVVQDFYSDNSQKRTDPYVLSRSQLMQFRATPSNGSLTTYAYNGTVMQQQSVPKRQIG